MIAQYISSSTTNLVSDNVVQIYTVYITRADRMDGWMNGVLGHFYALSRLNWAGDNLG